MTCCSTISPAWRFSPGATPALDRCRRGRRSVAALPGGISSRARVLGRAQKGQRCSLGGAA